MLLIHLLPYSFIDSSMLSIVTKYQAFSGWVEQRAARPVFMTSFSVRWTGLW